MIAGNNPGHAARAILCYQRQNWEQKELIVINSGSQDFSPLLEDIPSDELRYIHHPEDDRRKYGSLKNMGLENASGKYVIHWNESDWHHPDRIRYQASVLGNGTGICWLRGSLLHIDHPELVHHPYIDLPKAGYTGSLMHRNEPGKRYPEKHRSPDRAFLSSWDFSEVRQMDTDLSWLIIRCLPGGNRERRRFLAGLRVNSKDLAWLAWLKLRGRDRLSHPRFHLSPESRESFQRYLEQSRKLGLITSVS